MSNIFSDRLNYAMQLRAVTATELAIRSGVNKASISNYMNGRYKAKQGNLHAIATALSVSEAWLMGMDIPLEDTAEEADQRNNSNPKLNVLFSRSRALSDSQLDLVNSIIAEMVKEQNPNEDP